VDIRTFDVDSLMQTFEAAVHDEAQIKGREATTLAAYRARLNGQFDELFPQEAL